MFGRTGENHPMFGKTSSEETIAKISASQPNAKKNRSYWFRIRYKTIYPSINVAANALNIPRSRISLYFINNQQKPYKGRYIFLKVG